MNEIDVVELTPREQENKALNDREKTKVIVLVKVYRKEITCKISFPRKVNEEFKPNSIVWAKMSNREAYWPAVLLKGEEWNLKDSPGLFWVYWLGSREAERFSKVSP